MSRLSLGGDPVRLPLNPPIARTAVGRMLTSGTSWGRWTARHDMDQTWSSREWTSDVVTVGPDWEG